MKLVNPGGVEVWKEGGGNVHMDAHHLSEGGLAVAGAGR